MYILGISCFYHDSAAALLHNGILVAAAEEERFSRKKHDYRYPSNAIAFCLRQAGVEAGDVDYVVFYEKPLVKFERILKTTLGTYPKSWRTFSEAMIAWLDQKLWIKSLLQHEFDMPASRVLFTDHHMAHAASAIFCSPFRNAAVLTIDGVGEWATATKGYARAAWNPEDRSEIVLTHEQRFPHSLGLLYSAFTAFLGFRVNEGEYKVMGMSPYGEPRYVDRIEKLFQVQSDGSCFVNMRYFSYHYSPEETYNRKFVALFGPPRVPDSEFFTTKTNPDLSPNDAAVKSNQYYADVAASIQRVTEDTILAMANALYRETGLKSLCLAGGVALNSKANGRILRETPFEELFVQPAAGDSGGALGAAQYAYHVLLGKPREFVLEHSYWGAEYGEATIQQALDEQGVGFQIVDDDERIVERVVDDLLEGKVVAWYQGRFEWGPRALGNRSILADPRRSGMKNVVNTKIKFREPFRPFAPAILENSVVDFFDGLPDPERHYPARFMLTVLPFKDGAGERIPAVNHFGTGRLQTVRAEWNPRYHRLVEQFGEATSVPVLMNTSFNLRGEPIVNTPANALSSFLKSGMDTLIIGNFRVEKS